MSVMTQTDLADEARAQARAILDWDPPLVPHCSNCASCRVTGTPETPMVRCAAGFDNDKPITLWRVIRRSSPRGFRAAGNCPSFDSMD